MICENIWPTGCTCRKFGCVPWAHTTFTILYIYITLSLRLNFLEFINFSHTNVRKFFTEQHISLHAFIAGNKLPPLSSMPPASNHRRPPSSSALVGPVPRQITDFASYVRHFSSLDFIKNSVHQGHPKLQNLVQEHFFYFYLNDNELQTSDSTQYNYNDTQHFHKNSG